MMQQNKPNIKNLYNLYTEEIYKTIPETTDVTKKISVKLRQLLNTLDNKQSELLDELIELENEKTDIIEERVFTFGFSLGMNLCMESKEDID